MHGQEASGGGRNLMGCLSVVLGVGWVAGGAWVVDSRLRPGGEGGWGLE